MAPILASRCSISFRCRSSRSPQPKTRSSFGSASLIRMTNRSSGGPYNAKPEESGPRCFIDCSMRVISLPMSPVPSRWMMPAMPHMSFASLAAGAARPAPRRPRWVLRKDVQVLAQVPVGDRGAVALPLVGLVMAEDPVHLARHRVLDHLVLLQRRQRLAQRHRDLL